MKKGAKLILITAQVLKLIEAVLVFIIGLSLIINKNFDEVVSTILGVILILVGVATLVTEIIKEKSAVTAAASVNAGTIALGITCLITNVPLAQFLAIFLIVIGGYLVLEFILLLVKKEFVKAIIYLLVGAALVVFGVLFLVNYDVQTVIFVIVGVVLMIVAVLLVIEAVLDLFKGLKFVDDVDKQLNASEAE